MNKVILLNNRPAGKAALGDFRFTDEAIPEPQKGECLLKTLLVSVDPYLRGRMNEGRSYAASFELNKPIQSRIVAEVTDSRNSAFKKGEFVFGTLEWKEYQVSDGNGLMKVDPSISPLPSYLGVLGMTGLTAYLGLTEFGQPKAGETLVVSGGAGAVGNVVGQIGKILGCRVTGITGTVEKAELLRSKLKFDQAINYKTTPGLQEAIRQACPNGVDIYFDNVGGVISEAIMMNLNLYARIPVCGSISMYNDTMPSTGLRIQPIILMKRATMRGFLISDLAEKFPAAMKQLVSWLKEGKLISVETIVDGFDHLPQAFLDLFEGKNIGKMIVKI